MLLRKIERAGVFLKFLYAQRVRGLTPPENAPHFDPPGARRFKAELAKASAYLEFGSGGSTLAARACGLGWREGAAIGILMNTRGLMELVILNVGRDLGVITPAVFAMMVLMALVTTAMTGPLLSLALNWGRRRALPPGPLPRSA